MVAFDAKHFAAKRPSQISTVSMDQPFNPDKFNFNKANPSETIATVRSTKRFANSVLALLGQSEDSEDHTHPVLVNLSPLMVGHCVVPLWCEQGHPQLLYSPQHLAAACEIAISSGFICRVGFNSLGGFASINHLHVHIMPVDNDGAGFPIENAPVLECLFHGGSVTVNMLNWCVPSYCFEGDKDDPAVVVAMASILVNILVDENIPYNILFTTTETSNVRVIVIPRQPQEGFDPISIGFNGAVCELSGLLIANSQEKYDEVTEETSIQSLATYAALDQEGLGRLSEKLVKAISSNPKFTCT